MTRKPNRKPRRERRPEDRHAFSHVSDLLDAETLRKIEALKEQLSKEERK